MEYKVIDTKQVELGRFRINKDQIYYNGKVCPYSFVEIKPSISIFPIVEDQILLIYQYRHSIKKWLWEIPGGGMEKGENVRQAAERELLEETGFKVREYYDLGFYYPSAGSSTETAYLCAAVCEPERCRTKRDLLEKMYIRLVDVHEFCKMIYTGEFAHGMGLAAWARIMTGEGKDYLNSCFNCEY